MATPPKVRISPSPTGYFHVGTGRTALLNWLFARQQGGTFLLRIEDTDEVRNRPEWTEGIAEAMRWLGLEWDETYAQSRNADRHRETAGRLFSGGHAYWCGCTPEEVQARNAANGIKTPGYDGHCRDLGLEGGPGRALRFRTPAEGTVTRVDVVYGTKEVDVSTIEDFVLVRANGAPLFTLANAVDDIDDGITHVIRGADHLSNTEKQILLRQALGVPEPVWAHLPMLVNASGKKLSKRRDKVSMEMYRAEGILPEAMRNYLGTLGWAPPGDDEIVPIETMLETFRLEDVNRNPGQFDPKKLLAFNGHYLRTLPREQFVERALGWYRSTIVEPMADVIQERGATWPETLSMTDFFLHDSPPTDRDSWAKTMEKGPARQILEQTIAGYEALDSDGWTADAVRDVVTAIGDGLELKAGKVQAPVRVAVTGRTVGPPLWESLVVLGRDRTLERLRRALAKLPPASA